MPITEAGSHLGLNAILVNGDLASLHSADPGTTGANEISGGSYARQPITYGAAAGKHRSNTNDLRYTGMPATTVAYLGVWSAAGVLKWTQPMVASKVYGAGDVCVIEPGTLDAKLE